MKGYRVENAHFLIYAEKWTDNSNIAERTNFNIWFADDESFNHFIDDLYCEGYFYIRAKHNAYTDGHGNAWDGEEWVVPNHFYKNLAKVDSFSEKKPSVTANGQNKTWIIKGVQHWFGKEGTREETCYLAGRGRGGKYCITSIRNAFFSTEFTAKNYVKKMENTEFTAISLIDLLAINK